MGSAGKNRRYLCKEGRRMDSSLGADYYVGLEGYARMCAPKGQSQFRDPLRELRAAEGVWGQKSFPAGLLYCQGIPLTSIMSVHRLPKHSSNFPMLVLWRAHELQQQRSREDTLPGEKQQFRKRARQPIRTRRHQRTIMA